MSPPVLIRLVASESVTAGGTRKTTWLIFSGRSWVSLKDIADAEFSQADPGPGTIWETVATVAVAPGTWLQKIVNTPLREQRRDPMSYLKKEVRGSRRHVDRAYFRVNTRGALRAFTLDDVPAAVRESE